MQQMGFVFEDSRKKTYTIYMHTVSKVHEEKECANQMSVSGAIYFVHNSLRVCKY